MPKKGIYDLRFSIARRAFSNRKPQITNRKSQIWNLLLPLLPQPATCRQRLKPYILTSPPDWLNRSLERFFAAGAEVLMQLLAGQHKKGYTRGVSVVAVLRKF